MSLLFGIWIEDFGSDSRPRTKVGSGARAFMRRIYNEAAMVGQGADVHIVQHYSSDVGTGGGKRMFELFLGMLNPRLTVSIGGLEDIPKGVRAIVFAVLRPEAWACGVQHARRTARECPGLPVILLGSEHTIAKCRKYSPIPDGVTPICGCVKNGNAAKISATLLAQTLCELLVTTQV